MIFSELYSAYYNAIAVILSKAVSGGLTEHDIKNIIRSNAFSESELAVVPALKTQKWQLLKHDLTTPIKNPPSMPLTLLQKQWLKALLLDPRIKLFDLNIEGLESVEPLFTPNDYCIYDKYSDGDDFADEGYISRFKIILSAIRNDQSLCIEAVNRRGNKYLMYVKPKRLEYSEKDDKFRLITSGCRYGRIVNLGRITKCKLHSSELFDASASVDMVQNTVTLVITDERNALERVMLHFAHFEKQAERISDNEYRLHIKYDSNDETELVIRILSFGPMVRVESPESFVHLIKERLTNQKNLGLK